MSDIAEVNARFALEYAAYGRLVIGQGDGGARVLLIGEAPGAQEEKQLRPFVGAAGKHLDTFLAEVGLARESLYITNTVKFRPVKPGKTGNPVNRTPTRTEVKRFSPWLRAEIEAVRPEVIVPLGNTALFAILGPAHSIGTCHGVPLQHPLGTLFPLYHPASILYRRALTEVYAEDLRKLRAYLENASA